MGRDSDILVGIDLGTKKITVAVAERAGDNPDEAQIISIGQSLSRGMRKGMITNLEQAVNSVSDAIADAESMLSNVKISRAVVAFSAHDLECRILHGMISLGRTPRAIQMEDMSKVIETALSTADLPAGRCVINTIPIKYTLDGNGGIENPLDMTAIRLEVELTALIISTSVAQNVVNCVEKTGIKVTGLILKPLAEALGTLNSDDRAIGATLIAIGGGTTSVSVFSEGHLIHAAEIPVGGDHITNDIAYVMKIPFVIAEKLKMEINVSPEEKVSGVIPVEIRGKTLQIDKSEAAEIIESRLDELFEDGVIPCLKQIQNAGLPTDVIGTGGVMLTPGIVKFAESYLNLPVRLGMPVLYQQMQHGRSDCRYSAVSGIVVYLMEKRKNPFAYIEAPMTNFKAASAGRRSSTIKGPKRPSQSFFKSAARMTRELFKELF